MSVAATYQTPVGNVRHIDIGPDEEETVSKTLWEDWTYEDMAAGDSRFETCKYCRARWPPAVSREGEGDERRMISL